MEDLIGIKNGFRGGIRGINESLIDGLTHLEGAIHQFLPETRAWLAQLPSYPSYYYCKAIDDFIRTLQIDNNWQALDRLWIFATEQRSHAIVSLVNPTGIATPWPTNITEVTAGGVMNWAALQGYTGDGLHSYLNTNYNPSVNAVNWMLNGASQGFCKTTDTKKSNNLGSSDMGSSNPASTGAALLWDNYEPMTPPSTTGQFSINEGIPGTTYSVANGPGCYISQRTGANATNLSFNGKVFVNGTTASNTLPNVNTFICARSSGGVDSWTIREYNMAFMGGVINPKTFYSAFYTLRNTIGF